MSEAPRHHWIVRSTHWINALAFTIMVGSGLRIFNAYPGFARKGETFCCYPFEGRRIPDWLTFGGWLGGARHWHFAMMWVLVDMVSVLLHSCDLSDSVGADLHHRPPSPNARAFCKKKAPNRWGLRITGGVRGIRTLDEALHPILP